MAAGPDHPNDPAIGMRSSRVHGFQKFGGFIGYRR